MDILVLLLFFTGSAINSILSVVSIFRHEQTNKSEKFFYCTFWALLPASIFILILEDDSAYAFFTFILWVIFPEGIESIRMKNIDSMRWYNRRNIFLFGIICTYKTIEFLYNDSYADKYSFYPLLVLSCLSIGWYRGLTSYLVERAEEQGENKNAELKIEFENTDDLTFFE
jgi:hypothetical protein